MKKMLSFLIILTLVLAYAAIPASAATWTTHAYARFLGNGGTISGSRYFNQTYSYVVSTGANAYIPCTITCPNPTRTGYRFVGWMHNGNYSDDPTTYTQIMNGVVIIGARYPQYQYGNTVYLGSSPLTSSSDPSIFTACWEIMTYKITYVANNGESNRTESKTYDFNYNISSSYTPKKTGYHFEGWDTSSAAQTVVYRPGDLYTRNADLTLYAVWSKETYTVKYNANGGEGAPESQQTMLDDGMKVPEQTPYRGGYNFAGWAKSADSSEVYLMPGDLLPCENLELCALWRPALPENGAAISGQSRGEGSSRIYQDVYVNLSDKPSYISLDVVYPVFISYAEFQSGEVTDTVSAYENKKGSDHVLNLSLSNDSGIDINGLTRIGRIFFDVSDFDAFGDYLFSINSSASFAYIDGQKTSFAYTKNQTFSLVPYLAKSIAIKGADSIKKPTQYTVEFTPEKTADQRVEWSVDDPSVASVSDDGILTPIKNGSVTLFAKTLDGSELTAEYIVAVTDQPARISALTSSVGEFSHSLRPDLFSYTLLVPSDCDSLTLTAEFTGGKLLCDSYGAMISGIEKNIYLNSDEQELVLTRSLDEYSDNNYFITIRRTNNVTAQSPDVYGDTDIDGSVTIYDVSSLQKSIAGFSGTINFNELDKKCRAFLGADVDNDGVISIFDASLIQKWLVGDARVVLLYGINTKI